MTSYPIDDILPTLKEAVRDNPSVVLQAPPGSGKTTRAPLGLLEVILPEKGRIIMLEPRRIAAVSAARWMAQTLGEPVGETVGYSIRFDSRVSKKTRIEVMTEGILVRRLQSDPGLEGVSMVIFDEFHERSLFSDLSLALSLDVRRCLREDLKILAMSATLECGAVASLLDHAPVISASGEVFPVEERYRPDDRDRNRPLEERITATVLKALQETTGDILVFLPGAGEIRAGSESVRAALAGKGDSVAIHPLYGDLPFEEQERAILPSSKRKVVFATNIAETSLTIEGVKVVIDSGLARRLQHDPSTGMNRLITVPVSRASAEQRKGRAGRTAPGVCYRLYSRHTFQSLIPFTPPEMLISDLSSLALELALWGVKDPTTLSWLDTPPAGAWESARGLLVDLGALDSQGLVTPLGKSMARLPLHPRLGRLLHRGAELGCLSLAADLAALLSERDILRSSSAESRTHHEGEDITGRLDILHLWRKGKEDSGRGDPWALRAVDKTARQLLRVMGQEEKKFFEEAGIIPRLLLCAFPDRIAKKRAEGEGRFILSQGRGVRLSAKNLAASPFIVAVKVDTGEKSEGMVHLAEPIPEDRIREEMGGRIETLRRLEWNKREGRILSTKEERLGQVLLSVQPVPAPDDEVGPLLWEAIRSEPDLITFGSEVRQFQGRVNLMRRSFPEENWPDLSKENLLSLGEDRLLPWLKGVRTREQLAGLDLLPALRARLSFQQQRLLDERAPASIIVPSGHAVPLDYASGDIQILAVKLQEMFGQGDTPTVAGGRVQVILHLLSPARRPVQITQDLRGFWKSSYQGVKKELKGRYPKHPWPDDPGNAVPTRKTKDRRR